MCVQGVSHGLTNLLMKVQHVAVSENSDHNFCVSLRSRSGLGISHSLGKLDGIRDMVWVTFP